MAYPEYLPRQTLYHYTSTDGLVAIAKSRCLRFSDLAAANDPREIHLGREKVFVALRSVLDEEYKAGKGANLLHLITRLIAYFDGVQIFCCCLSMAEIRFRCGTPTVQITVVCLSAFGRGQLWT